MELELVREWLESEMPNYRPSGDGRYCRVECPWCGHQDLSIKIRPDDGEPVWYSCWSASCLKNGKLTSDVMKEWGCIDPSTLDELRQYNATVSPYIEKKFIEREARDYRIINLPRGDSEGKLAYINGRLGVTLTFEQLKDFKIQLSVLDMLRLNDIRQIATSKNRLRYIDQNCIGFVSIYDDYLICRDMEAKGKDLRYYNYRLAGKADPNDLKVYCLPTNLDLLDPRSANINVAEGIFSILGAYMHTGIGRDRTNSLFLANCGARYTNTILRTCRQYGLTKVRLNIFSDSEVKIGVYRDLIRDLKGHLDIRHMTVYYSSADDFGHSKKDIGHVEGITLI